MAVTTTEPPAASTSQKALHALLCEILPPQFAAEVSAVFDAPQART